MDYYFINTNANYLGQDTYKEWLKHNLAFTNGSEGYGRMLGRLQPGDICFMYVSKQGVRAVGRALERWDGKSYDAPMVPSPLGENEYRLPVDWFIELQGEPISAVDLKRIRLWPPRLTVQQIGYPIAAEMLLNTMLQMVLPEEVNSRLRYTEGATYRVAINAYERNPRAREACIKHYGKSCCVCGFNFEATYGEVAKEYIQVHHLVPLSEIAEEYEVDPVKDLRPVCPNCHAVIHLKRDQAYKPEDVRGFIQKHGNHP